MAALQSDLSLHKILFLREAKQRDRNPPVYLKSRLQPSCFSCTACLTEGDKKFPIAFCTGVMAEGTSSNLNVTCVLEQFLRGLTSANQLISVCIKQHG